MAGVVVIGTQWGDEGKGKFIDYLASKADVVVRSQGGNNAGHTIVVEGTKYALHLIPSGILYKDTINVLASGIAFNPEGFITEIEGLKSRGVDTSNIVISDRASVLLPYHKLLDILSEESRGDKKIGTTKKGIGPLYIDKVAREGIRVCDFIDPIEFKKFLNNKVNVLNKLLVDYYGVEPINEEEIYVEYSKYAEKIKPYVKDTVRFLNDAIDSGKEILFEGAQGSMLDVDLGTYPYVTSSHPTTGGFIIGSGIGPKAIDKVVGIVKAYTTRVGEGPFVTEELGEIGDKLRIQGNEFGTTTGRPRRCGFLDLVVVNYAKRINGITDIALSLLDVLTGFEEIKVCTHYDIDGNITDNYPASLKDLEKAKPIYKTFKGWNEDITSVKTFEDLPERAKEYIDFIEEYTNLPISYISVGAGRDKTIIR
ncbi:MAG: adenylosuccinate synthase [Clostridiales bacterium]|nr:MAG: adenylosuccinate synthase [Clostridiales bacterium]